MYKLMDKMLRIVSKVVCVLVYAYIIWVLWTPGYYHYACLFIGGVLLFYWFVHKLDKWASSDNKGRTEEELIEHRFAVTYRTRYYSKLYLIITIVLVLISGTILGVTLFNQFNSKLNVEFIEAINFVYSSDDGDCEVAEVFNKAAGVIPNPAKTLIIDGANIIRMISDLQEDIIVAMEDGQPDEELLLYWKDRVEDVDAQMDSTYRYLILYFLITGSAGIIFKWFYGELKSYIHHHSIEL